MRNKTWARIKLPSKESTINKRLKEIHEQKQKMYFRGEDLAEITKEQNKLFAELIK